MIIEPTDQWKRREEGLVNYLCSLVDKSKEGNYKDSFDILHKALALWQKLRSGVLTTHNLILDVPDCCPSSDEEFHIMFTWNRDEHYLECEVMTNGTFEMFYRNKLTKEIWGEDYLQHPENFLEYTELWNKLSYFTE